MEPNLEANLRHLIREWRRLAEAEGEAIRAGNWPLAQDCQREQAQLRSALERLSSDLEADHPPQKDERRGGSWLREEFAGLIEIEKQKLAWVEMHRGRLTERLLTAERSRVNLRKLRLSYSGADANGSLPPPMPSSTFFA
jgi:hypothetical protein